ncbi:MAG: hypothetical protein AVDCRST_MAG18-3146 [uncultured Thermomicrobiales bacterium]|uniref:DoxX family protein n=1 Tax=uncultured Thermomicrobiales bacterium TaxID=1645740 RepID=A0A6J4VNZ0_9BACT|nr:MAG: hypothetical protein AVDCRST_MAG18-3146 [uncultured Thermomicrobiales bacterium]
MGWGETDGGVMTGRTIARRGPLAVVVVLLGSQALAPSAAAHERWFVPGGDAPIEPGAVFSGVTLLALAVVAAAIGGAWLADRIAAGRRGLFPPLERLGIGGLANLSAWVPPILAIHAAIPLLVNGVQLHLFAPNLPLPRSLGGGLLAMAQILVALSFLYGAFTRGGAILLALTGLAGMLYFHPLLVLEHCGLLGIAAFLFITGRGAFSVDALLGRLGRPRPDLLPRAVLALRILTGFAVVVLGFTEKLWNFELAREFVRGHDFNFTRATPLPLSDDQFILAAGLVEVTVGALLISGLWTRLVILIALVPFNLSVPFFGWGELVGHLPIYGTLIVLLIWGPGQDLTPYIRSVEEAEARAAEGPGPEQPHPAQAV